MVTCSENACTNLFFSLWNDLLPLGAEKKVYILEVITFLTPIVTMTLVTVYHSTVLLNSDGLTGLFKQIVYSRETGSYFSKLTHVSVLTSEN